MNEIKICNTCEGSGQTYVNGDARCGDDSYWERCTRCNGTGRTIEVSIRYTIPYTTDSTNINIADQECHDSMRRMVKAEKKK